MGERERLDELFMTQALSQGLLSSVQIHRLMEEVRRRRMARPNLFAHDVAVELKLLNQQTALSLLRAEPVQQTLMMAGPELDVVRTLISAPAKLMPEPPPNQVEVPPVPMAQAAPEPERPASKSDRVKTLPPSVLDKPVERMPSLVMPQREVERPNTGDPSRKKVSPLPARSAQPTWDASPAPQTQAPRVSPLPPRLNERAPSMVSPAVLQPDSPPLESEDATEPGGIALSPVQEDGLVPTMLEAPRNRPLEPVVEDVELEPQTESGPQIMPTVLEAPQAELSPQVDDLAPDEPVVITGRDTDRLPPLPRTIVEARKSSITSRGDKVPEDPYVLMPDGQVPADSDVPQTMLESARLSASKSRASDTERISKLEPTMLESPPMLSEGRVPVRSSMPETPMLDDELRQARSPRPPSMVEPAIKTEAPALGRQIQTPSPTTGALGTGTGGGVRAGLGAGSQLGIESQVTDADHFDASAMTEVKEDSADETDIFGAEMTIAQLREKKGLGEGIQLDGRTEKIKNATRARFGDVAHRRYKVLREIARGGMGKVLEVIDTDLRRPVALKVLRSEMLDNKDIVERFLEEAQITGQLEHPNIVPVHEIGVDARKNLYFTMKLVEGMDLATIFQKLNEKDPETVRIYTLSKLLDILIKVCEGISFAHSKGVIHRDLKPPNIMVGRFGEVQIMDWGISRIVGSRADMKSDRAVMSDRREDESGQTMVGTLVGTPTHMSPEQARGETVTLKPSSDIFALGVILYEMLSLKLPWAGRQVKLVLDQVLNLEPKSPKEAAPEMNVPQELNALCMKCLVKDPERRLQSAKELMDNLRSYVEGGTMAAVQYSFAQLLGKWLARNKAKVITAGLVFLTLVLTAGAVYGYFRHNTLKNIPAYISQGNDAAAKARDLLAQHDFANATLAAADAQNNYSRVLDIDAQDSAAKTGAEEMSVLRGKIAADEEAWKRSEAERRKKEQEDRAKEERDTQVRAKLDIARAKLLEADTAFNGDQYSKPVRKQYEDARESYRDVRNLDETNKEAVDRIARIDAWMGEYDKQIKVVEQMGEILRLLNEAKEILGRALKAETYDKARPLLQDVIRRCDSALSIGTDLDLARPLHLQAADAKAQATLDFAARALNLGQFDFCEYMLGQATDTRARESEVSKLRKELANQRDLASKFRKQFSEAEAAISAAQKAQEAKQWEIANQKVREALAEAQNSSYATENDKQQLSQWAQLSRLEPVHLRDGKAANVDEMIAVEAEYTTLIDELLKDKDYRDRAFAWRLDLRNRLIKALRDEAAISKGDRAREYLKRALSYAGDEAQRKEIQMALEDVQAREAIGELDASMALLPRGSFLLGSTRDADNNPQRPAEHKRFVFIDKYLVTNAGYLKFVQAGGYEKPEYWEDTPAETLAAFVDTTGKPGPAGWSDGKFDATLSNLPVTGISWYEARAYAKWAGRRLVSADEWEIAAGAPRSDKDSVPEFPFGTRDEAYEVGGVKTLREVGTAEWDHNELGVRDMGCNGAEWTASPIGEGRAVVKGAEPGLKLELFMHFARRAKNSSAGLADRSLGRGFRCAQDYKAQ
jgi:formylglycine-generating enzyme required for sulfatase activity/tRNA A-37 threonylcarbamoyl transferase component Bud32